MGIITDMSSKSTIDIQSGQVLTGALFNEPMRVVTAEANGPDSWNLGLVGKQSEQFRRVTLNADEIANLTVVETAPAFDGDGELLRLGLRAHALGIAHEFDPYFALSVSRVDPLPHQLEAVYDYLLKLPSVRFLLADDAGAGKTIMAGLLIRELKLRGLVERIAVVCPANLSFQWQRELKEKFEETFFVLKGSDIRNQFGANEWQERSQVITSLDLAKRSDILPGLQQVRWDLVIVDEAHRMSARDESHKSQRYRLGEILRDSSDHILLLTATPHRGDPQNFTLFLQLLDPDAYADVKSIDKAMQERRAPFYLRRVKEAMVYFPELQPEGDWAAQPVFTKRITHTASFGIEGAELDLYDAISRFVKRQSARAAEQGDTARARAVGFLMALYQRRLASSARAIRRSLENRANRLDERLHSAQALAASAPPTLPDPEDFDELEESDRIRLEDLLDAVTLANNAEEARGEIAELKAFAQQAQDVADAGEEAKLSRLRAILQEQGFFSDPEQRLLIFTEFRDTLDYLVERLNSWGFRVGQIHGGMRPGGRDEPGTRLYVEQQFREGDIQVLVATEAAGEGINLQCCHILFNYDIPWNPNRLEQRMGRIHRYGQLNDCLIFNFVAANTIEGKVLQRLLAKLQEIRDALDDDAVFNVVGEILPAPQVASVFRDYYAGKLGDADLEDRLLRGLDESRFREICQTALEGLATRQLNLEMLAERRARAQERRVVPETIARFMSESAKHAQLPLNPVRNIPHTFDAGRTPPSLRQHAQQSREIASNYGRLSTDRDTAQANNLEWVTPGHPLFEALRRHSLELGQEAFGSGACFYSLQHKEPARLDFYRARVVDGTSTIVHERLFVVELTSKGDTRLVGPDLLGNMTPTTPPGTLPAVAELPEADGWLHETALRPFLEEARGERATEVNRIAEHVELSLAELLVRADSEIGHAMEARDDGITGAEGRLVQAENRHDELYARRERRRAELNRERAVSLQAVERLTTVLALPHPEREAPEIGNLHPNAETEITAMRVVMEHEENRGCQVYDVHEQNLGYDVTSLDLKSGELRLIEVKGLAAPTGDILLTPNERRVAEDRPECYWLYVVTNCADNPQLQEPVPNPAKFPWHEEIKVQHYRLSVKEMTQPMDTPQHQ